MIERTFIDYMSTDDFLQQPLIINKSEGVWIWDVDGKRYFDAIGGIYCASLGHKYPRLVEAMKKQIETLTLAPPLHSVSDVTLRFIDRIGKVTPGNLNFVKTYSGGSESIESAIKFTRQYFKQTGHQDKYKIISNYLSYHGATLGAMATGDSAHSYKFGPTLPGFVKTMNPKQLRDMFSSWEETCRFTANLVKLKIEAENPETVAAFLVEPICNTAGIIAPTEEYYKIIRKTCDEYNVILIFDEVLTGIGKTGDMFAAQTYEVTPDIICSGKGLSSGMIPIGSMIAREDMADAFRGPGDKHNYFAHGHTFANFPLGCAVATEVINIIEEEHLCGRARVMGTYMRERLERLKEYGVVREVRGRGSLLGVELVENSTTNKPFPDNRKLGNALKKTARTNGLVLRISPDWFAIAPPLISNDAEIEELCDKIEKSLTDAITLNEHGY